MSTPTPTEETMDGSRETDETGDARPDGLGIETRALRKVFTDPERGTVEAVRGMPTTSSGRSISARACSGCAAKPAAECRRPARPTVTDSTACSRPIGVRSASASSDRSRTASPSR